MTSTPHEPSGAPDDGVLVRHLHGELEPHELRALTEHLEGCDACRRTYAALEQRERRIGDALRETDPPAPHPDEWAPFRDHLRGDAAPEGGTRSRLIAAGVVFALLAAGLATPPVRAWVAEHWPWMEGTEAGAASQEMAPGHADLRFPVTGATLEVVVTTRPERGILALRWTDGAAAELSVTGGGSEQFEVGASLVRIHDERSAIASYQLSVPAGVRRVRVRLAGAEPREYIRPEGASSQTVIDLARP